MPLCYIPFEIEQFYQPEGAHFRHSETVINSIRPFFVEIFGLNHVKVHKIKQEQNSVENKTE